MEDVLAIVKHSKVFLRNAWPKVLPTVKAVKEQGLVLVVLLSLSAFFFLWQRLLLPHFGLGRYHF